MRKKIDVIAFNFFRLVGTINIKVENIITCKVHINTSHNKTLKRMRSLSPVFGFRFIVYVFTHFPHRLVLRYTSNNEIKENY